MSIFAPSPAGGSGSGFPPAGRPPLQSREEPACKRRSPRRRSPDSATPLPGLRAAPPAGPIRGRSVVPLPASLSPQRPPGAEPPAGPRTPTDRAEPASPSPSPRPDPFRRPLRTLARRAAPALPGGSGSVGRGKRRASPRLRVPPRPRVPPPPARHPPAAGRRRRRNCGRRGAGEVAPSQGPRPGGGEGAATAHRLRRGESLAPEAFAGAAAGTEGRGAHVGPAPRSPTLSPGAQGRRARSGARAACGSG